MSKKLLLINPFSTYMQQYRQDVNMQAASPPLSLGVIAALTSSDWEIEIADENFDIFEFRDADLVGITAVTSSVNRAYELSDIYRNKGIKTVIGGIHASMLPDEASKYFDAVVIGEAESVWATLLEDFSNNSLKKKYYGEQLPMENCVIPRRDLFHKKYTYANLQTSRGCPMLCDFCSVHVFNGSCYRQRPVNEVLDELETIDEDLVFFVDDNIIGHNKQTIARAKELFKGMIDRGIKKDWYCQASINFADDDEVLKYASESGCRMVLLGIESEKVHQLEETNKTLNLNRGIESYEKLFERMHTHGIAALGAMIYGMDGDSREDLFARTKFALESGMDAMQATIMTPLPGTGLFKRMEKEDRLLHNNFPEDWKYYHFLEIAHKPIKMDPKEFMLAMFENWGILYDHKTLQRKMLKTLKSTHNVRAAAWSYISNVERHNIALIKKQEFIDPTEFLKGLSQDFQKD